MPPTNVIALIDELDRLRTEEAMARVVEAARENAFGANEIHHLALCMANSGTRIAAFDQRKTADLASTGAPGSLSTLLCPLYLAGCGFSVPKLGVPGRPAGGIDVLAQLTGYRVNLDTADVRKVLQDCGYAHFLADARFAPLDADLFRFRQKTGAQDIPVLAAASLLAKKIACGITYAGLDVRVAPHGNFGGRFDEARTGAELFCAAAKIAGIAAVAVLTDARTLNQPFIGRGESLLALRLLFEGRPETWLSEHDDRCRLLASQVAASAGLGRATKTSPELADVFAANVKAQGSSMETFFETTESIAIATRRELSAPADGFLLIDIPELRAIFTAVNSGQRHGTFPDALGLILRAQTGRFVRRGDALASVRADDAIWAEFAAPLRKAFRILDLLDYAPGVEEIVRA